MASGNGSAQGHEAGIGGAMVVRGNDRDGAIIERVIALGDLSQLKPMERASYYTAVCRSVGLNPMTKPFAYISLQGKLTLYALRDATDQLRKIHNVSIHIVSRERTADTCVVTARASMPSGRTDESIGAVNIAGLKGENLSNALMKAETKAKRRVTLSICGLGWLDETEVEDVRAARHVQVTDDGEIIETPPAAPTSAPAPPEDVWLEWAMTHTAAMNEAKTPGALKAAFAKAYREAEARNAPQHIRESLSKTKDALKGKMEVG